MTLRISIKKARTIDPAESGIGDGSSSEYRFITIVTACIRL